MGKDIKLQSQRREMMLGTPISRLIPKMAIPTIVAMLVTSIYSMADTYFVSFLGTSATAAVGVTMSIDQIIMMAGSFLAFGANSYVSRLLGAKDTNRASATLSTAFFSAVVMGILVMVPGLIFTEKLVRLLGATPSSTHYAIDYANYILLGAPFMAASFVLNQCLRSEGSPVYSMFGIGIGGILNIALDPLFIFTFNLGVAGAAIATTISKFVGFCILIYPYIRRKTILRLSIKIINFAKDIVREIVLMGLPSLLRMGLGVVAYVLVNNIAGRYSDSALAATSVVSRIMTIPLSAMLGFGQGFQPVAGFNWGAKRYDRVRKSFRFSSVVGAVATVIISILISVFAKQIILLFTETDMEMLSIGKLCLISQCISLPLTTWVIVVNMMYAALGKPGGAIILGITRQGLCFIPVIFILSSMFGVQGVAVSQAVSDCISFLITIPFAVSITRHVSKQEKCELPLPDPEIQN